MAAAADTGNIRDSHPNERQTMLAQCYQRGYHLGVGNAIGGYGSCMDCATPGAPGGLMFKDVALEPGRRKVVPTSPNEASFADLMAERQMTKEERAARDKVQKKEPIEVSLEQATAIGVAYLSQWKTRHNVLQACADLRIQVVDSEGQSGVNVALHAEYAKAEARAVAAENELSLLKVVLAGKLKDLDSMTEQLKAANDEIAALKSPPSDPANNPQDEATREAI